jgi:hypothetical protein
MRNIKLIGIMGMTYLAIEVIFTALQAVITHGKWSLIGQSSLYMFVVGGLSGWLIGFLNQPKSPFQKWPNIFQWFAGAFIITLLEFISGTILTACGIRLWDYSSLPFNINGQVCLLFSFFWMALTPIAIRYDDILRSIFNIDKLYGKNILMISMGGIPKVFNPIAKRKASI